MRALRSECYKIRHTWLPWVHLALPVVYALLFFVAARETALARFDDIERAESYLTLLSGVLPIAIGAVTAKATEMEREAGNFQALLSLTRSRAKIYMGKFVALLIGALVAIGLAVALFAALSGGQTPAEWAIGAAFVLSGSIAIYAIHMWTAARFGGGASLGLGFVETLIAFLSQTGLGDGAWYYFPAAWPIRLSATYVLRDSLGAEYVGGEFLTWALVAVPMSACLIAVSLVWFARWDGTSDGE
ncbi:MAG: lantibiotic immunity ABC transporter MutG family permease subunit [Peptoniphilus sp.]|nr:lantibiotic immunity ABC transporter MutG family permease subunit [Peptoniphilus sp.]MDD7362675.1 lantibiotic immunity ABC transporter MutG family permease subunit [Bacillota bacterium]MDY6044926.1 lantibiotic immunity ABC transporter MutG family permease subunit [Peptoniphilus sp.]